MGFNEVLSDIEKLIGIKLTAINESTSPIILTKLDIKNRKYFIKQLDSGKEIQRNIKELSLVWSKLKLECFVSVEQALGGSASSRHHPETLFANLPYIQFFKIRNKKHLFLRKIETHPYGTLDELKGTELKEVKKNIEGFYKLNILNLYQQQNACFTILKKELDLITKKYSGDLHIQNLKEILINFEELINKLGASDITLDKTNNFTDQFLYSSINDKTTENIINDPFITGIEDDIEDDFPKTINDDKKANIRHINPTLSLIYDRVRYDEIELQPDFQRKDRLWSLVKKSKLIESILMGLPLPAFYFAEKSNGNWIIVDGLQRITTIVDYIADEFTLKDLEELDELNGKKYSELSRLEQRKLREHEITGHLLELNVKSDSLVVELFRRINTYGLVLSPQEIRSALNQGSSVKFLRYLASTNEFIQGTHSRVRDERQKDMELCLSGISFVLFGYKSYIENKFDTFLSNTMKYLNQFHLVIKETTNTPESYFISEADEIYSKLDYLFKLGINRVNTIFGEHSFRKVQLIPNNLPISKPLFELLITVFSGLTESQYDQILRRKIEFIDLFYNMINTDSQDYATWLSEQYKDANRGFNYAISNSTGKKVTIEYRFTALINMLERYFNVKLDNVPLVNYIEASKCWKKLF